MPGPDADAPVVSRNMPQELLLPGVRLNAKHFPDKQHRVAAIQLGKGEERVSVSHISHYAFFIFFLETGCVWWVACGVWRVVLGVWRVVLGVLFIC